MLPRAVLIPRVQIATWSFGHVADTYIQRHGLIDHVAIWPRGYSNDYCSHVTICTYFCSDFHIKAIIMKPNCMPDSE